MAWRPNIGYFDERSCRRYCPGAVSTWADSWPVSESLFPDKHGFLGIWIRLRPYGIYQFLSRPHPPASFSPPYIFSCSLFRPCFSPRPALPHLTRIRLWYRGPSGHFSGCVYCYVGLFRSHSDRLVYNVITYRAVRIARAVGIEHFGIEHISKVYLSRIRSLVSEDIAHFVLVSTLGNQGFFNFGFPISAISVFRDVYFISPAPSL